MIRFEVTRIAAQDDFTAMLDLFEEVFDDSENYGKAKRPGAPYVEARLSSQEFIGLVAKDQEQKSLGALAAYVLSKFEQERSEIDLYDLAVKASVRRQGVATALIAELKRIGRTIRSYVIFVQADKGPEDLPAQTLYRKLGQEEDVFHYDLTVGKEAER